MENTAFEYLKETMNSYYPLSDETWQGVVSISKLRNVEKGERLVDFTDIPTHIYFISKGLFRSYSLSEDDSKEVNKNFFSEGRFPASIIAALNKEQSNICIEALENSVVIEIHHDKYRQLLDQYHDLKWYHIKYIEKHWMKEKEPLEISFLSLEAKERYLLFQESYPELINRIPLYHMASRLGITPTQLSRIRKILK